MTSRVVALAGPIGSGKSTIAKALTTYAGYTQVSLADGVRAAVEALDPIIAASGRMRTASTGVRTADTYRLSEVLAEYRAAGMDVRASWAELKRAHPVEYRHLLQRMGTDVGREMFSQQVWVGRCVEACREVDGPVVVDDMRFVNELRGLQSACWSDVVLFRSVYITRPTASVDPAVLKHSSERDHLALAKCCGNQYHNTGLASLEEIAADFTGFLSSTYSPRSKV